MSCFVENDPRDTGYIALAVSIIWYRAITPEQALRLAQGKSSMKGGRKLTPEVMEKIKVNLHNGMTYKGIEKKYKISRYQIFEELKRQKCN